MRQYLSILLRNQFNLFYRFGYTYIPTIELIDFDGNITEDIRQKIVKKFSSLTPFEYDEEYLILQLDKEFQEQSEIIQFEINDIVAIFPLSAQAKTSIESKIDQRIKLSNPIFESVLPVIELEIENKEVEKAIASLWRICEIKEPLDKYLANVGLVNLTNGLEHRRVGKKASRIQNANYWEYLIAYERYDAFPNTTLGYFYDAAQIFAYSKGLTSFEGKTTHKFLEEINTSYPSIKISEVIKYFETREELKGYTSSTTDGEIKQYIITPLFLIFKDEIRKTESLLETNLIKKIGAIKNEFGESFYYAVILLGAFFGFRKFYDFYYDKLDLRFFKSYSTQNKISKSDLGEELKSDNMKSEEPPIKIEENNTFEEPSSYPGVNEINLDSKGLFKKSEIVANSIISEGASSKTDITTIYRNVIESAFKDKTEIELKELSKMIKVETKINVSNTIIKNLIEEMDDLEVVPRRRPEVARRKQNVNTLLLFNT